MMEARIDRNKDKTQSATMKVVFASPDRAITPGQILALYAGERCLGGGPIRSGGRFGAPCLHKRSQGTINRFQHDSRMSG